MIDSFLHTVNRWHQNPWPALRNSGDTTDAHSARVARLILHLWPDAGRDLLIAALYHDDHEGGPGGTGDVCGPSKTGDYRQALDAASAEVERARGTERRLSLENTKRLVLVDRLDAYRWVLLVEPRALKDPTWQMAAEWIVRTARLLGVHERVLPMLDGHP